MLHMSLGDILLDICHMVFVLRYYAACLYIDGRSHVSQKHIVIKVIEE